jgi:spore maturation protein CgeB
MREQGFISNRLFDATASGARVISDHLPGLAELFEGLVLTYQSPEELLELVRKGPELFPTEPDRLRIAALVAAQHSFEARAATLLAAARMELATS